MRSDEPTIIGLYVLPLYRKKGIGTQLMAAAVHECMQRQLTLVRVDVLSTGAKRTLDKLPEDLKSHLTVNDFGSYALDAMVRLL